MKIKGIAASEGIAIAKVYKVEHCELVIKDSAVKDTSLEMEKYIKAIALSQAELEKIRDKTRENIDEEHGAIFDAHIQIINDPELFNAVKIKIEEEKQNAAYAFSEVAQGFAVIFESMDNEYMRERAADIRDVSARVLSHLLNVKMCDLSLIDEEVILVAKDLTPSDTAQMDKKYVHGFITEIGGRTSHSAIMARSLEIPAVVGSKAILSQVENGDIVILDGANGEICINPEVSVIEEYKKRKESFEKQKSVWALMKDSVSKTLDGIQVELAANIGSPDDVDSILRNGAEGVGLYRTEFLYMGRDNFPSEDEQFEAYRIVLERMEQKSVVIRTLDIGGDKGLSYMDMPQEMNPFLGYRAIRVCLDRVDIFKTQLRALLRASVFGNLKIMFPMIATVNEFREAKNILMETKAALKAQGVAVSDSIELGIMVEIPAAAILADQFAKEVDFFSIGTNDLIQYTFAADRMNESVSYLYQPYNPSLLRLVKMVVDAAHKEGKWVGMCGEMAGDRMAIPLLLGLGLDEFSMSATSILPARHLISKLNKRDMIHLANKALELDSTECVVELVNEYIKGVTQ